MVLQGNEEGFSPPFDSSIYGASYSPSTPGTEYAIEYSDCKALGVMFNVEGEEAMDILPEGVEPYGQSLQGGVLVARYPHSTVGEYNEVICMLQVEDLDGEMAYYIPYIYVTNDSAMAAGRELAGAPKKIADIEFDDTGSVYSGTMERPTGQNLLTATVKPEQRVQGGMIDAMMPKPTPLLSIRHLPPIEGSDGCTQLVKWYADFDYHESDGERDMWYGPGSVSYGTESAVDPVHKLAVDDTMLSIYAEFDLELGVTEIQKEWEL